MTKLENRLVYLIVDGENIDRTLGQILAHKPESKHRPRWDSVKAFIEKKYQADCRALFFLNATNGISGSFVQALKVMNYLPIPLTGPEDAKVVDLGIIKTLEAIKKSIVPDSNRLPAVVLVSHDSDFKEAFDALDGHQRAVVAFQEYMSKEYADINDLKIYDLENDVKAFSKACGRLPRLRQIPIDEFDPEMFL